MKVIILSLIIGLSMTSFSQNEWWKKDKNTKGDTIVKTDIEVIEKEKDTTVEKVFTSKKDSIVYSEGSVEVIKNPSVEKLIKFKATAIPPNTKPLQDGYRIQLFFDQNRREVDEARKNVLQKNNEAETYVLYRPPNYVLLLGNFRLQLDAEKARARLLSEFPEAIVVKDKIELPKIPELNKGK